ncbi:hypothetical protein AJ80_03208 [Polytolypa hystricis UAMH7299]|uniref:DUF7136 domain-containing protein n=1 Tax=Polytolypa hystricis (strain UAMH7299) TaxID=1447883 RepID=A0A2B7YLD0_POLH7|nr:hypothetical protein AJ80_03208 [Polytolypa hystricis UAMH7299]
MQTLYLYPVSPLPNTTYHVENNANFPIGFAVDNSTTAQWFGYELNWSLSTPDNGETSLFNGRAKIEPDKTPERTGNPRIFLGSRNLPPGLYTLSWSYSMKHCYTGTEIYQQSSGGKTPTYKCKTREVDADSTLRVRGSYEFRLDRDVGIDVPSLDSVGDPEEFGPGTLIAQVIGQYKDDESCALLNHRDWIDTSTPTRPAEQTRTVPGAPVPSRATSVPSGVIPPERIIGQRCNRSAAVAVLPPELLPTLLTIWLLAKYLFGSG